MSNDTHLLKQSQTTIGHLRITAHIGKLLSLFCLLSGIFYLKLFFFGGAQTVPPAIHLPPELLAAFPGNLTPEKSWANFLLVSGLMVGGTVMMAWGTHVREGASKDLLIVGGGLTMFMGMLLLAFFAKTGAIEADTENSLSPVQELRTVAKNGNYDAVAQILTAKGLQSRPAGELLLTEIALRNGRKLPREQYERALNHLPLLELSDDPLAEGQLAYALEYHLHGKAVSATAQSYLEQTGATRMHNLAIAVPWLFVAIGLFVATHFLRSRIHTLRRYLGDNGRSLPR